MAKKEKLDNKVELFDGIPDLGFEKFDDWLHDWHEKNNGDRRPALKVTTAGKKALKNG